MTREMYLLVNIATHVGMTFHMKGRRNVFQSGAANPLPPSMMLILCQMLSFSHGFNQNFFGNKVGQPWPSLPPFQRLCLPLQSPTPLEGAIRLKVLFLISDQAGQAVICQISLHNPWHRNK